MAELYYWIAFGCTVISDKVTISCYKYLFLIFLNYNNKLNKKQKTDNSMLM